MALHLPQLPPSHYSCISDKIILPPSKRGSSAISRKLPPSTPISTIISHNVCIIISFGFQSKFQKTEYCTVPRNACTRNVSTNSSEKTDSRNYISDVRPGTWYILKHYVLCSDQLILHTSYSAPWRVIVRKLLNDPQVHDLYILEDFWSWYSSPRTITSAVLFRNAYFFLKVPRMTHSYFAFWKEINVSELNSRTNRTFFFAFSCCVTYELYSLLNMYLFEYYI
jgi:hypothetical protein